MTFPSLSDNLYPKEHPKYSTLLDHKLVQPQLHFCSLHYLFFNSVLCDQTEYFHLFQLPNTMSSILLQSST
jgi:hypothetical protein